MQISIKVKHDFDDDPNLAQEKHNKLLMKIHKEFPEAVWEKSLKGFNILL